MAARLLCAVVMVAALTSSCKGGTSCRSWSGGYGERSFAGWSGCSDGSQRDIECNLIRPGKYECKCMKDGAVVKSFEHTTGMLGDKVKSSKIANEMCGWDLSP